MLEWLIKTYSNEGDTVLDNCMGSGSTGVACVNTNREFIGIESDTEYFKICEERINVGRLPLWQNYSPSNVPYSVETTKPHA